MERDFERGLIFFDDTDLFAAPNLQPVISESAAVDARKTVQDEMRSCEELEQRLIQSPLHAEKGRAYELRGQIHHLAILSRELNRAVDGQKIVAGFENFLSGR